MNRLARLVVASGAGLALALTASPALAAPPSDSRGAYVEHSETSSGDGSYTREYRSATQYVSNENYTSNSREQETVGESSFDLKTQYTERENVLKMTSQSTGPNQFGETCRTNSQSVYANEDTRANNVRTVC